MLVRYSLGRIYDSNSKIFVSRSLVSISRHRFLLGHVFLNNNNRRSDSRRAQDASF